MDPICFEAGEKGRDTKKKGCLVNLETCMDKKKVTCDGVVIRKLGSFE